MGRRAQGELVLSQLGRQEWMALTLRREAAQALALRARIVLGCAGGLENKVVAARQRVTQQTGKWRRSYVEQQLDGLLDAPRGGALARSTMRASNGTPERCTHDCMRHGTTTLFAALDIDTGEVSASSIGAIAAASSCSSYALSKPARLSTWTCTW